MKKQIFTVTHAVADYPDDSTTKIAYSPFEAGAIAQKDFGVDREVLGKWIETKESMQDKNVFECGDNSVIIQRHELLDNKLENLKL
jgi:hypothetical protein